MEKVLVNKYWNVKLFIECSHNKALKCLLPPRNGLKLRNHLNKDSISKGASEIWLHSKENKQVLCSY